MLEEKKNVCHVAIPSTAKGSRIASQMDALSGSRIIVVSRSTVFSFKLLKLLLRDKNGVLIFHQQWMLPLLLVTCILCFVLRSEYKLVYDMHDLAEEHHWMSWPGRIVVQFQKYLERIVAALNIETITVSKGLATVYGKRANTSKEVRIYYNFGLKRLDRPTRYRSKQILYFGQIKKERLSIRDVRHLKDKGYSIDLYGTLTKDANGEWFRELLSVISETGGSYLGEYAPRNMSFLNKYSYSLMAYNSSRENIKYCMPNKLFQSLEARLICIVSESMHEVRSEFSALGCIYTVDSLPDQYHETVGPDWPSVYSKLDRMKQASIQSLYEIVS